MASPELASIAVEARSRRRRTLPLVAAAAAGATAAAVVIVVGLMIAGGAEHCQRWSESTSAVPADAASDHTAMRRLARLVPRGVVLVVDSAGGRLRVLRDGQAVRDVACSAGSGTVLVEPGGGRQWVFDTPLGERRVQSKTRDPVWTKPDWAFIEEGQAPPASWRERIDDVSLGDYSLSLGDGYLIHGTLFQTLLGQPVTHGCIRLGDEDLEYVWRMVPVGARVLLY